MTIVNLKKQKKNALWNSSEPQPNQPSRAESLAKFVQSVVPKKKGVTEKRSQESSDLELEALLSEETSNETEEVTK